VAAFGGLVENYLGSESCPAAGMRHRIYVPVHSVQTHLQVVCEGKLDHRTDAAAQNVFGTRETEPQILAVLVCQYAASPDERRHALRSTGGFRSGPWLLKLRPLLVAVIVINPAEVYVLDRAARPPKAADAITGIGSRLDSRSIAPFVALDMSVRK
jgi:hypothetical protein